MSAKQNNGGEQAMKGTTRVVSIRQTTKRGKTRIIQRRYMVLPTNEIRRSLSHRMRTRVMPFLERVRAQRGIRGVRKGERIRSGETA